VTSALNAFLATWSRARSTFGEGSPQDGTQFDQSANLRQLESGLEAAAPGARWSGSAASAYDAANTEHRRVIGELAGLDQKLGAQLSQSAEVVATGRRNLDAIRQWVQDAAASVPPGEAGEKMMLPIVQRGLTQLMDVVKTSNGDLNAIGAEIRALNEQYGILGDQKFAPKEEPWFGPEGEDPPIKDQRLEEILKKYQVSEDPDGTITVDLPIIGERTVTVSEAKLLAQAGPFGAYDIYQIQEEADAVARQRFPGEDQHDNNADAFRHAYANALLTQRFGPEFAAAYATAHERIPDNPSAVEAMDLYNNERGRLIGQLLPDASHEELADRVEQAVRDGRMVVVSQDGQGLSWSDQPDGSGGDSPPLPGEDPTTNPYPGY
jgi:hypothetical protein